MKHPNHISERQRQFLRSLGQPELTLQDIKRRLNLDDNEIARFLGNKYFWDNLKLALREGRKGRWLAIEKAANAAASILNHAVGQADPSVDAKLTLQEWQLNLLRMAIELAATLRLEWLKHRRSARSSRQPTKLPLEPDLCHPNAKEHEKDLIESMRQEMEQAEAEEAAMKPT